MFKFDFEDLDCQGRGRAGEAPSSPRPRQAEASGASATADRPRLGRWTWPSAPSALALLVLEHRQRSCDCQGPGGGERRAALPERVLTDVLPAFLRHDRPVPGMLYVLGGVSRPHAVDDVTAVDMLDTWSPSAAWRSVPPLLHKRRGGGFATFRSAVLAVGGLNIEAHDRLKTVDAFAAGPGAWRRLALPEMALGRSAVGVAVAQDVLVVAGGLTGNTGEPTCSCERCDLLSAEPRWEPLPDLPQPRVAPQCVVMKDEVLVVGGGVPNVGFTGSVESFRVTDAAAGWTRRQRGLEVPRHAFGCCLASKGGRMYLVACGGHNREGALTSCETVPLDSGPQDLLIPDLPEPRMGCSAAVITAAAPHLGIRFPCEWLVVLGGSGDESSTASGIVLALQLSAIRNGWQRDAFPPVGKGRCFAAAVVSQGYPA